MSKLKTWAKAALASTAAAGSLVMANANAALVDAEVTDTIEAAGPQLEMVGKAIVGVVVVIVVFSLVMSIIRKA